MKFAIAILLLTVSLSQAQPITNFVPLDRMIVWKDNIGIPGGIPVRETIFATIPAGGTRASIQSALDSCPSNQVVLLAAGDHTNAGPSHIIIPSYVTLRGEDGARLHCIGGSIRFGTEVEGEHDGTAHNITLESATRGSTNITLNNVTGIQVGDLLCVDQLNNTNVSNFGSYGEMTWGSRGNGSRQQGQTVEVLGISGTNVHISTELYINYTNASLTPQAVHYTPGCVMGGLENIKVSGWSNGLSALFHMTGSKFCWVDDKMEFDFPDGDYGQVYYSFRCSFRKTYYHDGYKHTSGNTDCSLRIEGKSSGNLIENNVFKGGHGGLIISSGSPGNATLYNYLADPYDSGSTNVMMYAYCGNHGAHPMFNLVWGNIGGQFRDDDNWGTSEHGTFGRNWMKGKEMIYPPYNQRGAKEPGHRATQAVRALVLDASQRNYNVVGNVFGCSDTEANDVFSVVTPTSRPYEGTVNLVSWGYRDSSDGGGDTNGSSLTFSTAIFTANWNPVAGTSTGYTTNFPACLVYDDRPDWFPAQFDWPPIDPSQGYDPLEVRTDSNTGNTPAEYFALNGQWPDEGPGPDPQPDNSRVISGDIEFKGSIEIK